MKYYLILFVFFTCCFDGFCQKSFEQSPVKIDLSVANKYRDGLKEGLWCEQADSSVTLCYYHRGFRYGLERTYRLLPENGDYYLYHIASYDNGESLTPEYYFYETGMPKAVILEKYLNRDFIFESVEYASSRIYQAFIQTFDKETGQLQGEGWALFIDEYDTFCGEVGQWTVYDKKNNPRIIQKKINYDE